MYSRLSLRPRRSVTVVLAVFLALAGAISTAQSAHAAAPQILTWWNKCVDVRGGGTADDTNIDEWGCNGTVSQEFAF